MVSENAVRIFLGTSIHTLYGNWSNYICNVMFANMPNMPMSFNFLQIVNMIYFFNYKNKIHLASYIYCTKCNSNKVLPKTFNLIRKFCLFAIIIGQIILIYY